MTSTLMYPPTLPSSKPNDSRFSPHTHDSYASSRFNEYRAYQSQKYLLNDTYKYIRAIENGSFGCVTLALNVRNGRKVALKATYKSNANATAMAHHEISMLHKLGHANDYICQLVDSFETSDFIILVLEYCANGDLYDLIHSTTHRSTMAAVDLWTIAKEVCQGLQYAHSLGIYHRDIKPENVLFTSQGHVKLCDWGLATTNRTSAEYDVGTEKYMAPEAFARSSPLFKNHVEYDVLYADYWSVGITLLTALFGSAPFKPIAGHSDSAAAGTADTAKSLESDTNFKNFVFNSKHDVLYDIYPSMNTNCFEIFMHLLKIGGMEDELDDYVKKISSRNLDDFIDALGNNWNRGLTVDDELDMMYGDDDYNEDDISGDVEESDPTDVFNMDESLALQQPQQHTPKDQASIVNGNVVSNNASVDRSPTLNSTTAAIQMPVPSLVESSLQSRSWYDLDDEDSDEEFERFFNSLSLKNGQRLPYANDNKKPACYL